MKHSFLAILAFLAILTTSNQLCFAQTNPTNSSQTKQAKRIEKIKQKVAKIGIGGKITVIRLDGKDFYGSVSSIENDGFQIVEIDLKTTIGFKYSDLKKVNKGDGEKNLITGNRVNPRRGWLYGLAIFGTLFVILAVALSDKDF